MLTDTAIRNAHKSDKAKIGKPFKLSDERGLFLLVTPAKDGWSKWWRLKYRIDGKEKGLSLGVYPDVSLDQARQNRDDARKLIAQGIDPSNERQLEKAAKAEISTHSLRSVANDWLLNKCEDNTPLRPKRQLNHVLPWLGDRLMDTIEPKELLDLIKPIEVRSGVATAKKTLQMFGQIWRYGVANGMAKRDITQDLKGALSKTVKKHFAALTETKDVAVLLKAMYAYRGTLVVTSGLKLSALLFQRPGEIRAMKWEDIDLETNEWRYLVTKTNIQHIVPLSRQAVEILEEIRPLTGHGVWVFPGGRNPNNTLGGRCMSENAITGALAKLGFGDTMTAHGFRAMARTVLDEVLGFRPDYIEHQLAHAVRDPLGRAYNRTTHLPERHKMMQAWADYLDSLRLESNVVAIGSKKAVEF